MSDSVGGESYRILDEAGLRAHLASVASLRSRLGGAPDGWAITEVGDGNLNMVFLVEGPAGDLCAKQSLPYVRVVGEGWPMTVERAFFEQACLAEEMRLCPERVPALLHWDPTLYCLVQERLSPHIIMRKGTIAGTVYPHFAEHITDFLARTLFFTSDLGLDAAAKKAKVALFARNDELCKITEDLIFTDPYMEHERNRWTTPELDGDAKRFREDSDLKAAVLALKERFMGRAEALLHGDLHTGSIMVTPDDTKVIDSEFALYGPIGFDVGKLIGNFLLCYFSQAGHEREPGRRDAYRGWLLETATAIWVLFEQKFLALWNDPARAGELAAPNGFFATGDPLTLTRYQRRTMRRIFEEALGYAGTSMIRRTFGLAHNADMEVIEDQALRASLERQNLRLARELIVHGSSFRDMDQVTALARAIRSEPS